MSIRERILSHDITPAKAGIQSLPAAVAAGAPALGFTWSDAAAILGCIFLALQIGHLLWRWWRQLRIDRDREAAGKPLKPTGPGGL